MRMMKQRHWAVFTLIEYMNVAKALCSWNKKERNYKLCPRLVYILLWHKTLLWIMGSTDVHWDTWFSWTFTKRVIKTRFCCRGHLSPTVKTNVYLYTDIDIFKTRLFFVCFWDEEGMKRKKKDSGKLWRSLRRTWEAVGTPKLGMGAKGRLKTALKPPPYLITDNSVTGMDSGTNGHVWQRGKSLEMKLN